MEHRPSKTQTSSWLLVIAFVIAIGLAATVYTSVIAGQNIKKSLLQRSDSIAGLLDTSQIQSLTEYESDLESPEYQQLKAQLERLRDINPDIRFAYVLAQSNDRNDSYFLIDSEDPESEDYSYPGQEYPEGNQDVANIYTNATGTVLPITKDRWGYWLSAFSPVTNDQGDVIAVFGMDIAASTYYTRVVLTGMVPLLLTALVVGLLVWLRRRARYQQRYLTEKAFFLSFASHEIRSPLTSVSWALSAVTNKTVPAEKAAIFLDRAAQSVQHILGTIEDVLNIQRTEGLASKRLNTGEENIYQLLQLTIDSASLLSTEKGCLIIDETKPENKDISGWVDVSLFKRVLSNLLVNAIKYSPHGSPVTVALGQTNQGWTVEFHNQGEPISKSDQEKIFSGFYRTDSAERGNEHGSGMGLMLCYDIIQRHRGTLELESTLETGTIFRIHMPDRDKK